MTAAYTADNRIQRLISQKAWELVNKNAAQLKRDKPHVYGNLSPEQEISMRNILHNQWLKKVRQDFDELAKDPLWLDYVQSNGQFPPVDQKGHESVQESIFSGPNLNAGDYLEAEERRRGVHHGNTAPKQPAVQSPVPQYMFASPIATPGDKILWKLTMLVFIIAITLPVWMIGTMFLGLLVIPPLWMALVIYTGVKGHALRELYRKSSPEQLLRSDHWLNRQRVWWWTGVITGIVHPILMSIVIPIIFTRW